MNSIEKYILTGFIIAVMLLGISNSFHIQLVQKKISQQTSCLICHCEDMSIKGPVDILYFNASDETQKPLFLMLAEWFAKQHTYDTESYDCVNYSRDLHNLYSSIGVESVLVTGSRPSHRWVRVFYNNQSYDIAPQLGIITSFDEEYPYQKIVNETKEG